MKIKKPKISIGSWAYAIGPYAEHPVPLEEVAKRLATLKFDGIELGGFKPHAHPDLYPTKSDREKLMDMFKEDKLEIPAYAADLWALPFAEGDPEIVSSVIFWGPKGDGETTIAPPTHEEAMAGIFAALTARDGGVIESAADLSAIGHRVCHGGLKFNGPAIVDDSVKDEIRSLFDLAPIENPYNLQGEMPLPGVGHINRPHKMVPISVGYVAGLDIQNFCGCFHQTSTWTPTRCCAAN